MDVVPARHLRIVMCECHAIFATAKQYTAAEKAVTLTKNCSIPFSKLALHTVFIQGLTSTWVNLKP